MLYRILFGLVVSSAALAPASGWACAACGCTLSSDWEEASQTKLKVDFRYDYINQDQLRSGTSPISSAAASQLTTPNGRQEVESYTKNNYLTAGAEYALDPSWKLALQVPYVIRNHSTLGTNSDGSNGGSGGGQYTSNTSNLGDMKVFARYQGFTPQHNLGVILGLKLPTGNYNLTGASTDPSAPGSAPIDRGLEPGTGTTDVVFGAYYTEALNKNWDYFTEALYQTALDSVSDYRPGDGFNMNLGLRYFGWESLTPQLQLNGRYVQHDTGLNSDTISTGGTLIYLSPGLIVPVAAATEIYAFFQLPLYQNLLGVQLAPTYTASLGARFTF